MMRSRYVVAVFILACSSVSEPEQPCSSRAIADSASSVISRWSESTPALLLADNRNPRLHVIFDDDPQFITLTSDLAVQERGVCNCCVTYLFDRDGTRAHLHRVNVNLRFKQEQDAISAADALTATIAGRSVEAPWIARDRERMRGYSWDTPDRLAVRSLELRVVPDGDGWLMLLVTDRSDVRR